MKLPHGMPDGLHMLEPSSWQQWLLAAAVLALVVLWLRRRRPRPAPSTAAPVAAAPAASDVPNVVSAIADLRRRHRLTADFRSGCHELARTVRAHLGGRPQALTARELEARYDEAVGRLMLTIAGLQWRRRRPREEEFDSACDLAINVLSATRRKSP